MYKFRFWFSSLLLSAFIFLANTSACLAETEKSLTEDQILIELKDVENLVTLLPFEDKAPEVIKQNLINYGYTLKADYTSKFGFRSFTLIKKSRLKHMRLRFQFYKNELYRYGHEIILNGHLELHERMLDVWKHNNGPIEKWDKDYEADGWYFDVDTTNPSVLDAYYQAIAAGQEEVFPVVAPEDDMFYYVLFVDCDSECGYRPTGWPYWEQLLDKWVFTNRLDLVENVLHGYNPSARIAAAKSLLKMQAKGFSLSKDTKDTIVKITKLNIPIYFPGSLITDRKIQSEQEVKNFIGLTD